MRLPDAIERDLRAIEMERYLGFEATIPQQAGVPRLRSLRASIEAELQKLGYHYTKEKG